MQLQANELSVGVPCGLKYRRPALCIMSNHAQLPLPVLNSEAMSSLRVSQHMLGSSLTWRVQSKMMHTLTNLLLCTSNWQLDQLFRTGVAKATQRW